MTCGSPRNLTLLNAILYVVMNACPWLDLPADYGRWHKVYTRMSRWAKVGVLDRVTEALQVLRLLMVRIEVVSLDSTNIKVHPDGTGAPRSGPSEPWPLPWSAQHQDSSCCLRLRAGPRLLPEPGPSVRCAGRPRVA